MPVPVHFIPSVLRNGQQLQGLIAQIVALRLKVLRVRNLIKRQWSPIGVNMVIHCLQNWRMNLLKDTMSKMKRAGNSLCQLKIDFIGEDGSDFGGPTNEFFTEFFESTIGYLVYGQPQEYVFVHDIQRLRNNEY